MAPLLNHTYSIDKWEGEISNIQALVEKITSLESQEFYLLRGEVGAGKTTLSQALITAWGITDDVTSPTFSIVNPYTLPNGTKLYHHDWYRLKEAGELFDAGIEEILNEYPSQHLIEWPEIGDFLLRDLLENFKAKILEIQIIHRGNQRQYQLLRYIVD